MLADPRADALVTNFAAQWLFLRDVEAKEPDAGFFPEFDENLRQAFRRETELFIGSVIREDRPVPDLLDADYSYLNERLARHYDVPHVYGSHFRRVTLPGRDPAWSPRAGQHPHADVLLHPHLPGPPRQVDSRKPARRAPAAPAAGCAGAGRDDGGRSSLARCARRWSSIAPIRRARAATRRWIRWGSPWRTSTPIGRWRDPGRVERAD